MNRDPTTDELDAGGTALLGLLNLLPALRVVVVHGGSTQRGWRRLVRRQPALAERYVVLETFHTSNQAFWSRDESVRESRRAHLDQTYRRVAELLVEPEIAGFWRRMREALAERPGVELEDHEVFAPALADNLRHR